VVAEQERRRRAERERDERRQARSEQARQIDEQVADLEARIASLRRNAPRPELVEDEVLELRGRVRQLKQQKQHLLSLN
jgi:hypothetical protein